MRICCGVGKVLFARTSLPEHRSAALPPLQLWLSSEQMIEKENSDELTTVPNNEPKKQPELEKEKEGPF